MARREIIYKELSYKIYGLLFKTQNDLGRYRNEKQYGDYLENLFKINNIRYAREVRLPESFAGEKDGRNVCDFIIEGKIILELKTVGFLSKDDYLQTKRYLASANLILGILVNFRQQCLIPKRILNNELLKIIQNNYSLY
ncbi:MAG TPA: GxxExxY protein [Candidatus Nanoarchaeia archaeon]|nr:GxxExxY protein [Candidatus Nanoarchaeia archaeon]